MFDPVLTHQATRLLESCRAAKLKLTTAESCTGGLVAALLTSISGSSDVVERGFVTYSNESKVELLNVADALIGHFGAVSEAVARAMAEGAIWHSRADVSIAITGIAGPGGGTVEKPVGLVHLATARRDKETFHRECRFEGNRDAVRLAAVIEALGMLEERI